jgi:hypothetical protein
MNKQHFLLASALLMLLFAGCKSGDFLIMPKERIGNILLRYSHTELQKAVGRKNVVDDVITDGFDIDTLFTSVVNKGKPDELTIVWDMELKRNRIMQLEIDHEQSPYKTKGGIGIGSKMSDVVKENGKPITFYGFGWDYGGVSISFNDGAFENSGLIFVFNINDSDRAFSLMGDDEYTSDDSVVKNLIDEIFVDRILLLNTN